MSRCPAASAIARFCRLGCLFCGVQSAWCPYRRMTASAPPQDMTRLSQNIRTKSRRSWSGPLNIAMIIEPRTPRVVNTQKGRISARPITTAVDRSAHVTCDRMFLFGLTTALRARYKANKNQAPKRSAGTASPWGTAKPTAGSRTGRDSADAAPAATSARPTMAWACRAMLRL